MPRDFAGRGGGARGEDDARAARDTDGAGGGDAGGGRDTRHGHAHARPHGYGPGPGCVSTSASTSVPAPLPASVPVRSSVPGPCTVPDLTPVRPGRRGGHRLHRLVRGRRRVAAAGLAVVAAAFAAQLPRGERDGPARAETVRGSPGAPTSAAPRALGHPDGGRKTGSSVLAPVRIADAEAVRLLHSGDRVDVIAGPGGTESPRVVARNVLVDRVPRSGETDPVGATEDGALVVLRVPRATATALAGAGADGRLAVTLC